MMGSNMHYAGWLAIQIPELKEANSKQVTEILSKVQGVARVQPYLAQHAIGIEFDSKGRVTSQQMIDALAKEGIKAANY